MRKRTYKFSLFLESSTGLDIPWRAEEDRGGERRGRGGGGGEGARGGRRAGGVYIGGGGLQNPFRTLGLPGSRTVSRKQTLI